MALHAVAVGATLFAARDALLAPRLPAPGWLVAPAAGLFAAAAVLARARARAMPFATMLGAPEVDRRRGCGSLVTTGPYARVRHPRYAEGVLALAAAALFTGRVALYALAALFAATAAAVAVLEERELRRRFGPAWEDYAARVPRFVPRISRCGAAGRAVASAAGTGRSGDEGDGDAA